MSHTTERLQAKILFVEHGVGVSEIAKRLHISDASIYRWASEGNWKEDRKSLLLISLDARKSALLFAIKKLNQFAETGKCSPSDADAFAKVMKAARTLIDNDETGVDSV